MKYTLSEYASRNELNKIIANNMIHIAQLQDIPGSFEEKAIRCFSRAYMICRDIIEESPVSIYKVPDYYGMASYPYGINEDHKTIMKAVTISVVMILTRHFDEKWKADNREFLDKLHGVLWEIRLKSEKNDMFSTNSTSRRRMFWNPICMGFYDSLRAGTDYISFTIPFDEFDPTMPEVLSPEETIRKIVADAMETANANQIKPYYDEQNEVLYLQGAPLGKRDLQPSKTENSGEQKDADALNTRIEQLKAELEKVKEENESMSNAIEGYRTQGKGISAPDAAMLVTAVCDTLNQTPANGRETLWPILSICWGFTESTARGALRGKMTQEKASKLARKFEAVNLIPRICNILKGLHEKLEEKKKQRLLDINPKVNK